MPTLDATNFDLVVQREELGQNKHKFELFVNDRFWLHCFLFFNWSFIKQIHMVLEIMHPLMYLKVKISLGLISETNLSQKLSWVHFLMLWQNALTNATKRRKSLYQFIISGYCPSFQENQGSRNLKTASYIIHRVNTWKMKACLFSLQLTFLIFI